MVPVESNGGRTPLWLNLVLWVGAAFLMLGAMEYQERTGPTKELRGSFSVNGVDYEYEVIRSGDSREDARIAVPSPATESNGSLVFKRFNTDDQFTNIPLEVEGNELAAYLPKQPAAGKLEFFIEINTSEGVVRIPESSAENAIIRFKDPVPIFFLLPHILMMFFALLIGMRTGLAAIVTPHEVRKLAWVTLVLMTIGGMILGPIVQKYAFGALWTGVPFGYDLTDNKTLIMWIVWLAVCVLFVLKRPMSGKVVRSAVLVAATVMVVVYLIPHSVRGSQLDYDAIDAGASPEEAVRTGQ